MTYEIQLVIIVLFLSYNDFWNISKVIKLKESKITTKRKLNILL